MLPHFKRDSKFLSPKHQMHLQSALQGEELLFIQEPQHLTLLPHTGPISCC